MGSVFSLLTGFVLGAGTVIGCVYYLYADKLFDNNEADDDEIIEKERSLLYKSASKRGSYAQASSVERSGTLLTDLLASLWTHFNKGVSAKIIESVEPSFKTLPGPLKTLRFINVSLGDIPIKLDNVIVHKCYQTITNEDYVQFDIDCIWDGNCNIQLKADYLGTFGVKSIKLAGRMSFILQPLMNNTTLVGAIQYGFVNVPHIQLDFTGLANIADISSIKSTIKQTILDTICNMMVLPNRMLTKLDESKPYFMAYHPPIGIVRLTIQSGYGFIEEKRGPLRKPDIPDVYCITTVGGKEIHKTNVIKNNVSPVWNESVDFILFDHDQTICIIAMDSDKGSLDSDDVLGSLEVSVGDLLLAGKQKDIELIDENHKGTNAYIKLHCNVMKFVTNSDNIFSNNGSNTDLVKGDDKSICGLVTILVSQAIGFTTKEVTATANTKVTTNTTPIYYFVKVTYDNNTFYSSVVAGEPDPVFDCSFRVPIMANKIGSKITDFTPITFTLYQGDTIIDTDDSNNNNKKSKSINLGTFQIPFSSVVKSPNNTFSGRKELVKDGNKWLEYCIMLHGIDNTTSIKPEDLIPENIDGSLRTRGGGNIDTTIDSSGPKVIVSVIKGWGFQIQKRRLRKNDIPDVYCKIKYGSSPTIWRTKTIKDNVAPVWKNETKTYPFIDNGQIIHIDVYDEDKGTNDPDDYLGTVRVSIGKILLSSGSSDVELTLNGKPTGCFLTINCTKIDSSTPAPTPKSTTATDTVLLPEKSPGDDIIPDTWKTTTTTTTTTDDDNTNKGSVVASAVSSEKKKNVETVEEKKTLKITAIRGTGFQIQKRKFKKDDIPDVYCKINVSSDSSLKNKNNKNNNIWKTSTIKNCLDPVWNESKTFTLNNNDDKIYIDVYDEDSGVTDTDDYLGSTEISINEFIVGKEVELQLKIDKKETGCSIFIKGDWITQKGQNDTKLDSVQPAESSTLKDTKSSVPAESSSSKDIKSSEVVSALAEEVVDFVSDSTNNEVQLGVTSASTTKTELAAPDDATTTTKNVTTTSTESTVSKVVESSNDAIAATMETSDMTAEQPKDNVADVKQSVETVKKEQVKQSVETAKKEEQAPEKAPDKKSTVKSISITAIRGTGFKVEKRRFRKDDIPDVYCKIKVGTNNPNIWRTSTIDNCLDPVWNESRTFALNEIDETMITIDAWDEDSGVNDPDDFLGTATISIKELIGRKEFEVPLQIDGKDTGSSIFLRCGLIKPKDNAQLEL